MITQTTEKDVLKAPTENDAKLVSLMVTLQGLLLIERTRDLRMIELVMKRQAMSDLLIAPKSLLPSC